jgi:hypothetical protein
MLEFATQFLDDWPDDGNPVMRIVNKTLPGIRRVGALQKKVSHSASLSGELRKANAPSGRHHNPRPADIKTSYCKLVPMRILSNVRKIEVAHHTRHEQGVLDKLLCAS